MPGSLPPGAVSIWLGRFVASDTMFSAEQIDLLAYPYARLPEGVRPCEERIGHDPDLARRVLLEAGSGAIPTSRANSCPRPGATGCR